ncbi:MAG: hypothetical protein ACK449_14405, partial [Planctomycetota bacterium]
YLARRTLYLTKPPNVDDFSEIICNRFKHGSIWSAWSKAFSADFGEISDSEAPTGRFAPLIV